MYCAECGFHQNDAHTYCGRCGALLIVEGQTIEQTGPLAVPDEAMSKDAAAGLRGQGPMLAVRWGGGLSGEHFPLDGDRTTIGREPSCDIFLDDVTVSRRHAVITKRDERIVLADLASLNGTYVNRRRILAEESLTDGDELQIGKFRLVFINQ